MGTGSAGAGSLAQRLAAAATRGGPAAQQHIFYLLNKAAHGLQVSTWVGQSTPGRGRTVADTVSPFTTRASLTGADFPRYVDPSDKKSSRR